ncbi:MAG: hypothetical protein K2X38_20190 [Gemmataceae bacterium]|nr:hypothetical protein [Gemmataceae bacterium]
MWKIGIDEAGYGPNLGPFVMTAVACRVPDEHADECLWKLLKKAVRRKRKAECPKLFIDDSKEVYSSSRGLRDLECSVLAFLQWTGQLGELVDRVCPGHELHGEHWFAGDLPLPCEGDAEAIRESAELFARISADCGVEWRLIRSEIVCPPAFNVLIERTNSKGAVLGQSYSRLVTACLDLEPKESIQVVADKHGGRNQYVQLLQEIFGDGWVMPREEGMELSRYEMKGYNRPIEARFMPKADGEHFVVAVASMVSKYLRETLMAEFNRWWQTEVPGITPTAGYPSDALRFLADIRGAVERRGWAMEKIWRSR